MNIQNSKARNKTKLIIAAFTVLYGCTTDITTQSILHRESGKVIPGKILAKPIKTKSAIGEAMLTAGEYSATPNKISRKTATTTSDASANISHKLKTINFHLTAATLLLEGQSESGFFYKYPHIFATQKNEKAYGGLFAPKESPNLATKVYWNWTTQTQNNTYYTAPLTDPIPLTMGTFEEQLSTETTQTPRQVLIYSGVSAGQIRFVYREFTTDGLARPLFTQDVVLDYHPGETYAFKNARFIVEKAGPAFIEFTLIQGLE